MPTTPGLNIADPAVWNRVMAAFNNSQAEFKAWNKEALRIEVLRRETEGIQQQADDQIRVKRVETATLLDGAT